jgi:nucleoside-specific outer membrane channel protein Tsx
MKSEFRYRRAQAGNDGMGYSMNTAPVTKRSGSTAFGEGDKTGPFGRAAARLLFLVLLLAASGPALAEDSAESPDQPLLKWMQHSATLLLGTGFELPGDKVTTLTLEHSSAWRWGDVFAFVDIQDYHDHPSADSNWYGEFAPRLSLGRVAGLTTPETSLVRDVLLAATYERGDNGVESLLLGFGVDFRVRGFTYLKLNTYARKDTSRGADFEDMQLTLLWAYPFQVGGSRFLIDGFADYVAGWGPQENNLHVVPQIKWDLGAEWDRPGVVYVGTEIDYWRNQFGVRNSPSVDSNQLAVNLLLKIHF